MSGKLKRGRPATGKKAYCIRLSPEVYLALREDAKAGGYPTVGDWLTVCHSWEVDDLDLNPIGAAARAYLDSLMRRCPPARRAVLMNRLSRLVMGL